jgi:hypothetical protein
MSISKVTTSSTAWTIAFEVGTSGGVSVGLGEGVLEVIAVGMISGVDVSGAAIVGTLVGTSGVVGEAHEANATAAIIAIATFQQPFDRGMILFDTGAIHCSWVETATAR